MRQYLLILYLTFAAPVLVNCAEPEKEPPNVVSFPAQAWTGACDPGDSWDKPGPPFHIHGQTYYVGTCGIASILITGENGHVLIDGGPEEAGPIVIDNVKALGFDPTAVKLILHSHEHYDHVGALAYLQRETGARVMASETAKPVLESGVVADNDPQAGMHDPFPAIDVDAVITDGETVQVSDQDFTAYYTPGHTPGALSWTWQSCEGEACLKIVYMDSLSAVSSDTYKFSDHPEYVAAFEAGLNKIETLPCDIGLAPHPEAVGLHQRLESGQGLLDKNRCATYAQSKRVALHNRQNRENSDNP